jgi:signal transduction histidine kinase
MTINNQKGFNPETLNVFETMPGMYLILSKELVIITASNAYLAATRKHRDEIVGKVIFEVFPHDLDEPFADSITFSLNFVLQTGEPHYLPAVKILNKKIQNELNAPEGFWSTAHEPILDELHHISYIIHHTQDVTKQVLNQQHQENLYKQEKIEREKREYDLVAANNSLAQANEEIQSYNDELHAANDELNAANIDLYHAKEELRQLNIDLETTIAIRTREAVAAQINSEYQQKRLFDFCMQAPAGICLLIGPDLVYDLVNTHYQKLFPGRCLIGKPILKALPELNGEPIINIIKTVYITGKAFEGKELMIPLARNKDAEPEERYFNFIYQPSRTPSDEVDGVLVFVYEVTELVLMLKNQKYNEQKKDEFLSIASHELKTPLTSIRAFNQLIRRAKDSSMIESFLQKSADSIIRMEKLVNDLLDVTKINAGKMNYEMQEFDFLDMLKESIASVQYTRPSHQIILESEIDVIYKGDRFRIEQVMVNFLTNAIKYSPHAHTVTVNCELKSDNIIVSVKDNGIGIASEDLHKLFDRYYRVDNTEMRFEGLGLGLFISSEILKRHQGSFWVESTPGVGSTFFFRLPLYTDNKSDPVQNLDSFYEDNTIRISLSDDKNHLNADWIGFQSLETVQRGCMNILRMLSKNKLHKVVNDNTLVLGTWSEAADWVGQEWFPMMEKEGLKYFAWIYSPSAFSLLSAQKTVDIGVNGITTQFFTDKSSAEFWIGNK